MKKFEKFEIFEKWARMTHPDGIHPSIRPLKITPFGIRMDGLKPDGFLTLVVSDTLTPKRSQLSGEKIGNLVLLKNYDTIVSFLKKD